MLDAAMDRKYSGNPGEGFFTGGGMHHFGNFSKLDDARILTVHQALQHSTNLVFVRLMRDVVRYYMFQLPGSSAALLADADDPRRAEYLARFADREGKEFLGRFYNKYKGKTPADAEKVLLGSFRPTAARLAAVHRTVMPEADPGAVRRLHHDQPAVGQRNAGRARRPSCTTSTRRPICRWPTAATWPSLHPLELWVVGYLRKHPGAGWKEVSDGQRQGAPGSLSWLFNDPPQACPGQPHRRPAGGGSLPEDPRPVEEDGLSLRFAGAVVRDHPGRVGRPAGGAGRDDGHHRQRRRAQADAKASTRCISPQGTPYETMVEHAKADKFEQVISPEVARTVADAIRDVVADGTAKRRQDRPLSAATATSSWSAARPAPATSASTSTAPAAA